MSNDIQKDERTGIYLLNLNWGYQVNRQGQVLAAIQDTLGGPHRTPACTDSAQFHFKRLCALFTHILDQEPQPTPRTLYTLISIIKAEDRIVANLNSVNALRRRGAVRIKGSAKMLGYKYSDWEVIYPEAQ